MNHAIIKILHSKEPGKQVSEALQELIKCDGYLLKHDVNERSISHRFAMYLQSKFPSWDVDCEYNRDGIDPKRIGPLKLCPGKKDTQGQTVFPDIVVHKRGTNNNYLVIEIKKSNSTINRNIDHQKLQRYMSDLSYRYALFIELGVGESIGVSEAEWVNA